MKKLSSSLLKKLFEALHYLHKEELKEIAKELQLPLNGKKGELIARIFHFVKEGIILKSPIYPSVSLAKKPLIKITSRAFILRGSYKNDEKTRNFFKKLIGDHFHFTAAGQDWIHERWLRGEPPTYGEFATFWEKEWRIKKSKTASPKQEWAYITFFGHYSKKFQYASLEEMRLAWEKERERQKEIAFDLLGILRKK